jgi:hypothetical protein
MNSHSWRKCLRMPTHAYATALAKIDATDTLVAIATT